MNHQFVFKRAHDDSVPITPDVGHEEQHSYNNREEYKQYKKILAIAHTIQQEKLTIINKVTQLLNTLSQIQKQLEFEVLEEDSNIKKQEIQLNNSASKLKRSRRRADDISRQWQCKQKYCDKRYGAHASLLQHIKLKHPSAYSKYC